MIIDSFLLNYITDALDNNKTNTAYYEMGQELQTLARNGSLSSDFKGYIDIPEQFTNDEILRTDSFIIINKTPAKIPGYKSLPITLRKNSRGHQLNDLQVVIPKNVKLRLKNNVVKMAQPLKKSTESDIGDALRGAHAILSHIDPNYSKEGNLQENNVVVEKHPHPDHPVHFEAVKIHYVHDPKSPTGHRYENRWAEPEHDDLYTRPWRQGQEAKGNIPMRNVFLDSVEPERLGQLVDTATDNLIRGSLREGLPGYQVVYINKNRRARNIGFAKKIANEELREKPEAYTFTPVDTGRKLETSIKRILTDYLPTRISQLPKTEGKFSKTGASPDELNKLTEDVIKDYLHKHGIRTKDKIDEALKVWGPTVIENIKSHVNKHYYNLLGDLHLPLQEFHEKHRPYQNITSKNYRSFTQDEKGEGKQLQALAYIQALTQPSTFNNTTQPRIAHIMDAIVPRLSLHRDKYNKAIQNLQNVELGLQKLQKYGSTDLNDPLYKDNFHRALINYVTAKRNFNETMESYANMMGTYAYMLTGIRRGANKKSREKGIDISGISELTPKHLTFHTDNAGNKRVRFQFKAKGEKPVQYDLVTPHLVNMLEQRVNQINDRAGFLKAVGPIIDRKHEEYIKTNPKLYKLLKKHLKDLNGENAKNAEHTQLMPGKDDSVKKVLFGKSREDKDTLKDITDALGMGKMADQFGAGSHLLRKVFANVHGTLHGAITGLDLSNSLLDHRHLKAITDIIKDLGGNYLNPSVRDIMSALNYTAHMGERHADLIDLFKDFTIKKHEGMSRIRGIVADQLRNQKASVENYLLPHLVERALLHGAASVVRNRLNTGRPLDRAAYLQPYQSSHMHLP